MILDADVLIDVIRGYEPAVSWFQSLDEMPSASGIAAMELIAGCRNGHEMQSVRSFLSAFQLAWPTETDLRAAFSEYLPRRLTIGTGLLDSIVAATAIGLAEPLATYNVKHFTGIPEVVTVQPYTR